MDHLAACFRLGLRPTGSEDPHALRRAAQGLVRIVLDARWRLDMPEFIATALDELSDVDRPDAIPPEQAAEEIEQFIADRIEGELDPEGVTYDLARAVLGGETSDLLDVHDRALALRGIRRSDEDAFERVIIAAERTANIVRAADTDEEPALDPDELVEPEAIDLHQALAEARSAVGAALADEAHRDYEAAWRALAEMCGEIDSFFDEVMVMADDPALRHNRLALLAEIDELFLRLLDVQQVVIEGEA
jgi:glycyl-tRNA synthetase beta chain